LLCHSATPCIASILRPPPTPPLLPYSTLFRSISFARRHPQARFLGAFAHLSRCGPVNDLGHRHPRHHLHSDQHSLPPDERVLIRDRKSTRLNSSHVKISYAVFCLKKKTTTQEC